MSGMRWRRAPQRTRAALSQREGVASMAGTKVLSKLRKIHAKRAGRKAGAVERARRPTQQARIKSPQERAKRCRRMKRICLTTCPFQSAACTPRKPWSTPRLNAACMPLKVLTVAPGLGSRPCLDSGARPWLTATVPWCLTHALTVAPGAYAQSCTRSLAAFFWEAFHSIVWGAVTAGLSRHALEACHTRPLQARPVTPGLSRHAPLHGLGGL